MILLLTQICMSPAEVRAIYNANVCVCASAKPYIADMHEPDKGLSA